MRKNSTTLFMSVMFCFLAMGCSHTLQIKNLQDFTLPFEIKEDERKINLGIKSCACNSDQIWYFNTVIESLSSRREFGHLSTNYVEGRGNLKPDFVISVEPHVKYETSGVNFFINFPGGLIFTPAWNGYVYYANVTTNMTIWDGNEKELKRIGIDTPYSIRQSEFDRAWWPIFQFSLFNIIGGIYTSTVYDSDITPEVKDAIKTNYGSYVTERIETELRGLYP